MGDASIWITWLLIGIAEPASDLPELLDARHLAATQAAEAAMRGGPGSEGVVGCTAGHDADAMERAGLIARRVLALRERVAVSGRVKQGAELSQSASARSSGVYPGAWMTVGAFIITAAGGEETCVAMYPRGAKLPG